MITDHCISIYQLAWGVFKELELVSQESPLRVYVNPDPDQPDEWEVPAGSGIKVLVFLPS